MRTLTDKTQQGVYLHQEPGQQGRIKAYKARLAGTPDLIKQYRVHVRDVISEFCASWQSDGSRHKGAIQTAVLQHCPEGIHNAAAHAACWFQPLLQTTLQERHPVRLCWQQLVSRNRQCYKGCK